MRKLWIVAALALTGCASSTESLQRATAMSVGGNVLPESVQVSDVQRGMMDVRWTAEAAGRTYSCSADDMVRRPYCARR